MKKVSLLFTLILIVTSYSNYAQENSSDDIEYEVNRILPPISYTKAILKDAQTLEDINPFYKPSWIKEILSVDFTTTIKGENTKVTNHCTTLSPEQLELMQDADTGHDISVVVNYIPDNNLSHNEAKDFKFTITIDSESEALYPGGHTALLEYLQENAIDKISSSNFEGYDLTVVNFTINKEGSVEDVHIMFNDYTIERDEKTEAILLQAICNMPSWSPAQYSDGTTIDQEYVLTVGNHQNCTINMLNTKSLREVIGYNEN